MSRQIKPSVGVIGLGIIGTRVASTLRRNGYQVWLHNRSPRPEHNFLSSPAEVADATKHIQIFVSDGIALLSVIKALAPALTPEHVVMNHATVSPQETQEAAELVASRHAKFLDAPFTGSRVAAENGELVYYIGGDPAVLAIVHPLLEASSKDILRLGDIGQASIIKIATNLLAAAAIEALAEAQGLLAKSGIEPRQLEMALRSNVSRSLLTDMKISSMISGNFEPQFALKHMFKDVQLALKLATEKEIELPVGAAFAGSAMAGIQQGWGDLDFSVISRFYGFSGQGHLLPEPSTDCPAPESVSSEVKKTSRGWSLFRNHS